MDFMYQKDERDGELKKEYKLSSKCNSKANRIEGLQEAFDDDKMERLHILSFPADKYTKDSLQTMDVCSISSSVSEESSVEDVESKIPAGISMTRSYVQDQPCNSGHVFSPGMDPLSCGGVNNYETMDGFNDKSGNLNNNRPTLDPLEAGLGETMGCCGLEETNRDYVVHHLSENVSKCLHSSDASDKDKLIMDLKSEVWALFWSAF